MSIEARAKEYADKHKREIYSWDDLCTYRAVQQAQLAAYSKGAEDQKVLEIDKACYVFCHIGCPHKTDSYNCLKDKCDTWKTFRRMMEE